MEDSSMPIPFWVSNHWMGLQSARRNDPSLPPRVTHVMGLGIASLPSSREGEAIREAGLADQSMITDGQKGVSLDQPSSLASCRLP